MLVVDKHENIAPAKYVGCVVCLSKHYVCVFHWMFRYGFLSHLFWPIQFEIWNFVYRQFSVIYRPGRHLPVVSGGDKCITSGRPPPNPKPLTAFSMCLDVCLYLIPVNTSWQLEWLKYYIWSHQKPSLSRTILDQAVSVGMVVFPISHLYYVIKKFEPLSSCARKVASDLD